MNSFGDAIEALKDGKKIRQKGWKALVPSVEYLKHPRKKKGDLLPDKAFYQRRKNKSGEDDLIPWLPNLSDMLIDEWEII